jgi:hypothetical protein
MDDFIDRVIREREGMKMFSCGRQTYRKVIAPNLESVQLSVKARGHTLSSAQRYLGVLVAQAVNAPKYEPAANLPEHAGKRGRKRRGARS